MLRRSWPQPLVLCLILIVLASWAHSLSSATQYQEPQPGAQSERDKKESESDPINIPLSKSQVEGPFLAMGVKVGEVSSTSVILWSRLTKNEKPNRDGYKYFGHSNRNKRDPGDPSKLWGACPGASGRLRIRYALDKNLTQATATEWTEVDESTDYTCQLKLRQLQPASTYYYVVEAAKSSNSTPSKSLSGQFQTAPKTDQPTEILFTSITGQGARDLTHDNGYAIYNSMRKLKPDFFVPTGDTIYLDSDWPRTTNIAIAHYHWQRSGSLSRHIKFRRQVPGYWMKDDHDVFTNDCWPTLRARSAEPFRYEDGRQIFLQQKPMSEKTYRTFRWGRDLQIWLVEARDFRMPNDMPDGPKKTMWGEEQKAWLKRSVEESDATWKVLFSPTPIVGPPRQGKFDNQSSAFIHEGREVRQWLSEQNPERMFIVCGDIHYQYHSVEPKLGVQEFSTGPASDEHSGGSTGKNKVYHQFHRVRGGFLSGTVSPVSEKETQICFRFHSVKGKVVYEYLRTAHTNQ